MPVVPDLGVLAGPPMDGRMDGRLQRISGEPWNKQKSIQHNNVVPSVLSFVRQLDKRGIFFRQIVIGGVSPKNLVKPQVVF